MPAAMQLSSAQQACSLAILCGKSPLLWQLQEGDGVSPTAIREILLLRDLRHEHIVKLAAVHVDRTEPSLSLAFEYAEHDMYEIIWHHRDKLAGPIEPYVVKSLMWQLLNGLSYLHQNWIIHRDLKPSNVLVMGEGPDAGVVKVADFGLARSFQAPLRSLSHNGVVVTIWYRPPELLLGARHYTRAVDMWGAGCIFAELLMLRPLFQGQERKEPGAPFQLDQLDRIFRVLGRPDPETWPLLDHLPHWGANTEDIRDQRPEWNKNRLERYLNDAFRQLGDAFMRAATAGRGERKGSGTLAGGLLPVLTPAGLDLLQHMLAYDPDKRISAADALQHPYFEETPYPGPNAFVCEGKCIASYPRRHKQTVLVQTEGATAAAAAAVPDASAGTASAAVGTSAASAARAQQQGSGPGRQQHQQQQRRSLPGQQRQQPGVAQKRQQQQQQHRTGQQQQQQQPPSGGSSQQQAAKRTRKAEGVGLKGDKQGSRTATGR
eukprot:GHRR01012614.1.p1 GENE.GHRR01012614.1~~GHRR01012614.1.p1  ORF type:complete len:490 (+),score=169.21 GHRR01012614.1:333-1802(+)